MAEFDLAALTTPERYKLMSAAITPRPIAWVTTQDSAGRRNAAPYSFFTMVGAEPAMVVLGLMERPDGTLKDSAANILSTGEFVVNLVTEADAPAMNQTCVDAPPGVDEIALADVRTVAASVVQAPRIATAPVALECRLFNHVQAGHSTVVLGEVLRYHIADELVNKDRLHVDTLAMNLVARMHGAGWYTRCTDLFQLERPVWDPAAHQAPASNS